MADYWDASKKVLMDSYFINRLKEFDRDNIPVRECMAGVNVRLGSTVFDSRRLLSWNVAY